MSGNGQQEKPSGRYRLNVVLFTLLALVVALWFQIHLREYFEESALIGGTLTLWGLWKILESFWTSGWKAAKADPLAVLVGPPAATAWLLIGLIVAGFLWLTTSSMYFEFADAREGETSFTVRVLEGGDPFVEPVVVSRDKPKAALPLLLRARPANLNLELDGESNLYYEQEIKLSPWKEVRIRVPGDFSRRRAVRLIPPIQIWTGLPERGDDVPNPRYGLVVVLDGAEYPLPDLRFSAVYLGDDDERIRGLIPDSLARGEDPELEKYLAGFSPEDRREHAQTLNAAPYITPTPPLRPDGKLSVKLIRYGPGGPVEASITQIEISAKDPNVKTVILEAPSGGRS